MSRSYRKFLSWEHFEFDPPEWGGIRIAENRAILDEMRGNEYGELVFSPYYGSREGSWYSSKRLFSSKKDIRNEYFTEIRNILNHYEEKNKYWHRSCMDEFLRSFGKIRGELNDNCSRSSFEWLNTKEAQAVIKSWKGAPLDVLHYLAHKGLIEKAVKAEAKRRNRK